MEHKIGSVEVQQTLSILITTASGVATKMRTNQKHLQRSGGVLWVLGGGAVVY